MNPEQPPTQAPLTHRQVMVVFGALMLGMLLAALDMTVLATALPTIVGEFNAIEQLSWVITAYLLASTAMVPLYGKLSDIYGRKRLFQIAITLFLAGSLLSGASQSMLQLIVFRGIQGLGAGGIMTMPMAIIGDILAPRERGRYMGYFGIVFALASIAGPLVGGAFTDHISWRWIFYVNLPLGITALIVTTRVLQFQHQRREHRVDFLGAALIAAGISCLLLALTWGGNEYAWRSPTIVGLFAAGGLLIGLFILQETRAVEPILPLRLFRNSVFSIGNSMTLLVGLTMLGSISFLPLYFQVVKGVSATSSGLHTLPMVLGVTSMSFISGRMISAWGRYKVFPITGSALMSVAIFFMSRVDESTSFFEVSLVILTLGLGLGLVMQVLVLAVQNAVERPDLGVATASVSFFRQIGGSFGVAMLGAILANRVNYHIERLVPAGSLQGIDPASLRSSPEHLQALPPEVHAAVVEAFANAVQSVYFWALPPVIVVFVLSWVLRELPLRTFAHVGREPGRGEASGPATEEPMEPRPTARPAPTEAAEGAPGSG